MPKRKPKDLERSPDMPHQWIERHINRLAAFTYIDPIELTEWDYRRARLIADNQYEDVDSDWRTIRIGEQWGGPDTTAFFRHKLTIPASHIGDDVFLDIDMDGGETQLSINGYPWQGLDRYRSLILLGDFAEAGRTLDLSMEAFIINYPYDERVHDERELHIFKRARLLRLDRIVEAGVRDLQFVLDAYLGVWHNDANVELERFLLHHLENACRAMGIGFATQEEAREAARVACCVLRDNVFGLDYFRPKGSTTICAHSHLDIVYLWQQKETLRKNCRTTTNMLSLMREYPAYRYSQSQPWLYEKLQELYPDVFEEVKQRITEGRWEVMGAMYVEPDGNLIGAESLVRQILFGKRYLRQELGVDTAICWLPDVFGIMYTLPQILRKSGINYFLTVKLNIWNDTNIFPHDSFRWRGLDGSEVITHFPPTHFAQNFTPDNFRRNWQDYREKTIAPENLFIYGWGDGGGGPTREMVQAGERTAIFPGLPAGNVDFVQNFFERLEARVDNLPIWDDELYMEGHRGTYTTKAELKRSNRKVELLYRDAEILSAIASLYGGARVQERLNEGWKLVLLNQFHDTLPGSHVGAAVPDIRRDYDKAFAIGRNILTQSLSYLTQHIRHDNDDLAIFNTLGWRRNALVAAPYNEEATAIRIADGDLQSVQHYGQQKYFRASLPSLGWTVGKYEVGSMKDEGEVATFADGVIETGLYRIELDGEGNFGRIYDKTNDRDILSDTARLQVFEDNPGHKFSAWDVAYHLEEYAYPVKQTAPWQLVANGPLFAVLTCTWQVLNSTIEQEMWLYADDARIDFKTTAQWQDSQKMLKAAFPLNIRTRTAAYDLPFGHIERPTHRNTGWEQAKFEVNGHKWADMSEGDYGVAILNDCKYGYDARENVLRISLIRSPLRPDSNSDIGVHEFTYSLYPHAGGWREGQVDRAAYGLNIVPLCSELDTSNADAQLPTTYSLLQVDSQCVIVEVLKQAEDSDNLILRTFDSHGSRQAVKFSTAAALKSIAETDLLEEQPEPVAQEGQHCFVERYRPYEIKTHRLTFR